MALKKTGIQRQKELQKQGHDKQYQIPQKDQALLSKSVGGLNNSVVSEFVLLGLSSSWETKVFLMLIFSLIYLGIILGNLFIFFLVIFDSHLHSRMYFLLANLLFIDVGLASTTVPKMIRDLLNEYKLISFQSCMTQICFIHIMGGVEMVLLIAMAFDRYTAICKPLHYLNIMNPKICVSLVIAGWVIGVIHAMSQFAFIINLPFCGPNEVDSFYCDFPRIIKLACTGGHKFEFIIAANSGFMTMSTFFLLILSYIFILVTVWKRSSRDLSKAFVTLSAHITVVVLFFTPCMFLYVWPFPTSSIGKYLFIVDFAITPVLNPAIYALWNKDIAIKRLNKRGHYIKFC
ncbi:olfactory receptor 4F21-like [Ursus arctos]|uniref:olfactory receptor 4F21-like n=1 Tax=Ursus arctos TaxID=9644 RepID=UPI0025476E52|nr:olfactory receptor 4F21-like [Ursus arctos]